MSSEWTHFDIASCVDMGPRGQGAAVDRSLLDVVPPPPAADIQKLEETAARHRVLILRGGAVIAITTLISVGGALLIHALAAGVLVVGFWFPSWIGFNAAGRSNRAGPPDSGGAPGGFSILGDGPDDNAPPAPQLAEILGNSPTGTGGLPVRLPSLPEPTAAQMAAQLAAPTEPLPVFSGDLGTVALARVTPQSVVPDTLVVAPPSAPLAGLEQPLAGGTRGLPARGTGAGDGGGDDERIFPLLKGDGSGGSGAGGFGTGTGRGRGSGIDRGLSAADRQPQLLTMNSGVTDFSLPLKYQLKPPEKSVRVTIAVAADGSIRSVTLVQSCGITEVDQMACDYVKTSFRFSPAYRAGKAVPFDFPFEFSFKPFD
jgi:TonB family protein